MATTAPSRPQPTRPARPPGRPALLVGLALAIACAAVAVVLLSLQDGNSGGTNGSGTARGSGVAASETRTVPSFTAVDLAGTSEMTVQVGQPQHLIVRADDNLLGHVVTEVRAGVLVVSDRGSFTSRTPMSVAVTVPSLRSATLSGTAQLVVTGVAADTFSARLPGTGTMVVSGRADRADASVSGEGALRLESLLARDVTAAVGGTGSAVVYASGSLHATVSGTGSVVYTGHPQIVSKTITGVGSVSGS